MFPFPFGPTAIKPSQNGNLLFCQPRSALLTASRITRPSLADHILNILILRAQEKMLRVNAPGPIAAMANFHSFWNLTIANDP